MTTACDRVRDLAPGFVLGALDPADMAAVRRHLTTCTKPHPELREMGGVLPYIGGSLDPVEPPSRLRASVLAAVQSEMLARAAEQAAPAAVVQVDGAPDFAPEFVSEAKPVLTVLGSGRSGGVVSLARARTVRTRRAAAWISRIAAAVAVISLVGYAVAVQGDLAKAHQAKDHTDTVYSYMSDPGARSAVLTPMGGNKGAGDAVMLPSGHVFVLLHGLAATKGDEVYMVWLSSDSGPISKGGWFTVDDQGEGFLHLVNVAPADSLWVMVCRETNSGVEKPTGPVVVTGTIWAYLIPAPTPTF